MTVALLWVYIGILTVLFLVALVIIGVAMMRTQKKGSRVSSETAPIPDASHRNTHTRVDSPTPDAGGYQPNGEHNYNSTPSHSDVRRHIS
ncbi:MAG TPA: hypothetical protein VL461_07910 [Dictyobacter sp.]|nr:hypothetical protein [Dictyobacter sp.]